MNSDIFKNKFFRHVLFWLCAWGFGCTVMANWTSDYPKVFFYNSARLPVIILLCYFNIYILLPRFLLTKKYFTYAFTTVLSLVFFGFCQRLVMFYIIKAQYPQDIPDLVFEFRQLFFDTIDMWPFVALTCTGKFLRTWYKDQQRTRDLERQKLQTELQFLKTQIHPHFFFNTLNNLYALTLIKSDDAPEVVLKLSGLMDYLIYESNETHVSLPKELQHIKNYLALEKLRFGKRLELSYNVTGEIENKFIAPMLILPFVENAFKHGVRDSINEGWINIHITVDGDRLSFTIENSKPKEDIGKPQLPDDNRDRIGLKNVMRRLDLLYADQHDLILTNTEESFKAALNINLSVQKRVPTPLTV
jgi:two-component system LytT family sensor kinase